ncbi:tryptophan--tRNA ligase [Saccharomonospora sp. CUA-673]|uniref:tryptophan--tRNA ligase n=1 Tax=Saccharomonospora sp. CUA-673 TaxID=1904969 RepID=UPI000969AB6A|nr:tryptophan--tRNA ligase [Saccharomonospora sp. CUA-673]OLT41245.1 tryptophan--tRNA ligase [Saccharomonospora sp. CUA-673]
MSQAVTSGAKVSLTGIKPTGEPHLGNLIGAIRPALKLAEDYDSVYFIADYHALTSVRDPEELRRYTRSVAATWLAAGLDPKRTTFYVQSDVPEIFELNWVMSCMTGKGLMNRAHAYKAARDRNDESGEEPDAGVNMGLYNYPILMAVDILIMESDVVPVGKDQLQHVEYAADIAGSFNHVYGKSYSFKIPEPIIPDDGNSQTLPGLDGRKMSKSYDNTIPLFLPEKKLLKLVRRIPTDSTPVEEPKNPDTSAPFQILEQFGSAEVVADTRKRLEAGGMGWGELKNVLFEVLNTELAPLRERYDALMEPGSELDTVLAEGAQTARERAGRVLASAREAIGLPNRARAREVLG